MKQLTTHEKIQYAVLELMETKDLSKIHVKEVTDKLNISRQAFYLHYDSVYAVVQELQDTFLRQLHEALMRYRTIPLDDRYFYEPNPAIIESAALFRQNSDLYNRLSGENGTPMFQYYLRKYVRQYIVDRAMKEGYIHVPDAVYPIVSDHIVNVHASILESLLRKPLDISDADLATMIYRLMFAPFRLKKDADK